MKYLLTFAVFLLALEGTAQRKQQGKNSAAHLPVSERIYFGGGGNFGGGTDPFNGFRYTYITASPLMGYIITMPFSVGAGVNYTYVRFPDVDVTLSQYGVSPFARYQFGKLFAYAEYSMISVPAFDNSTRAWYSRFPVGLGYSLPLGGKATLNAMALYDVKYSRPSVFASPWVLRVFISAGALTF